MVFGERPSQTLSFSDSPYPENRANDTYLALLFSKLALICVNEVPSMVAGIQ